MELCNARINKAPEMELLNANQLFHSETAVYLHLLHSTTSHTYNTAHACLNSKLRVSTSVPFINPQRMREGYSTHFVCLCVCVCVTYDSGGYADLQR